MQAQANLHIRQRANAYPVQTEFTVYVSISMEEVAFSDTVCSRWKRNNLEVIQCSRREVYIVSVKLEILENRSIRKGDSLKRGWALFLWRLTCRSIRFWCMITKEILDAWEISLLSQLRQLSKRNGTTYHWVTVLTSA